MNDRNQPPKKPLPKKPLPKKTLRQGERNPEASLQQKLRNYARATGEETALVLTRYINERFLARLSLSPYREQFILRGATLFAVWNAEPHRATRDIDLLASGELLTSGDILPDTLRRVLAAICAQPVPSSDGVGFLLDTLQLEERTHGRVSAGLHLELIATLGTARPRLEIDLAVGEAVVPPPADIELPVLLAMPPLKLRAYQRETTIAEKCEALVSLGLPNTRLKDFYDLWFLSRTFPFAGELLCAALGATFTRRGTPFPAVGLPLALTDAFGLDPRKQSQWNAFVGKTRLVRPPDTLSDLLSPLRTFLQPPLQALVEQQPFPKQWTPEGFWHD